MKIRQETPSDIETIRIINKQAFGQENEAGIVDALRKNCSDTLSLVAEVDGQIVGHILFSPVKLESKDSTIEGKGLGPMAVLPELQGQGIGSALVREGIRQIKQTDCPFIVLIGHEGFYPRFGFEPASKYGFKPQWQGIPDAAFMVLLLDEKSIAGLSGTIRYRPEFES